LVPVIFTF
jgi:hypothetical protein